MGFDFIILLCIPLVMWMLLKSRQKKLIDKVVGALEGVGEVYFGQDGGYNKPRTMVVVAVDEDGEIVAARVIILLRLLKPAAMYELPEVVGEEIVLLKPKKITQDMELRDALRNLKKNYIEVNGTGEDLNDEPKPKKEAKVKKESSADDEPKPGQASVTDEEPDADEKPKPKKESKPSEKSKPGKESKPTKRVKSIRSTKIN